MVPQHQKMKKYCRLFTGTLFVSSACSHQHQLTMHNTPRPTNELLPVPCLSACEALRTSA